MAQTTLLRAISAAVTSTNVYVARADSITLQCNPQPSQGFSGVVTFDVAFLPNLSTPNTFPIVTYHIPVWFQAVILTFSAHTTNLAFTLPLTGAPVGAAINWIRARVVTATRGALTIHAAY
jgi:hypothetical protein